MTFEEIKNQIKNISIKDYLETVYGCEFKRVGTSWFCISPIRAENNPSFTVKIPGENLWYDFGCGMGGDIIKLVQCLEGCTFTEAVERLKNFVGIIEERKVEKIQNKSNSKSQSAEFAKQFYNSIRKTENQLLIKRYFKTLGLPLYPEIGVTEYRSTKDNLQFIVFPCPDSKNIISLECRAIVNTDGNIEHAINGKKIRKTLGKKVPWVFYRSHEALITESIIDSLAGEMLYGSHLTLIGLNGVGNVKFLPEIIHKYQISKVHLALDADEAGQIATKKAINILPQEIDVYIKKDCQKAGVKDLYQLLKIKNQKEGKKCLQN